jgi:homoserine kinase type II
VNVKEVRTELERAEIMIKEHYDLGEVVSVGELHGGFVNRSFVVHVEKDNVQCKYMVREYNLETAEDCMQFEHALISHLTKDGFSLVGDVIPKKDGGTYAEEQQIVEGRIVIRFWAVFEFLKGEDRYTFMDTNLSKEELTGAADALARLHHAGRDFCGPSGAKPARPKIMDFLPTFRQAYAEYSEMAGQTRFDQCFLKYRDGILEKLDRTLIADSDLDEMPQLPIHGDYHQGNLKFEGRRVTGVFDFDWSRIDIRLFDLAQAVIYFCARWDGQEAGSIDLDRYVLFLRSYNESCEAADPPLGLTAVERAKLPLMLAVANHFALRCIVHFYYLEEDPDVEGWLGVLNHYREIVDWIEAHENRIATMTYRAFTSEFAESTTRTVEIPGPEAG